MSRWFRHYAGMMRDEKLVAVALRAKQPIERVVWIWGAILESAAEINDGGRFDFDPEEAAHFLHVDVTECNVVVTALSEKGRVTGNAVANWDKRQWKSDDSTDRVRKHRLAKKDSNIKGNGSVTCNADETLRNAPETETETETKEEKKENCPNRVRTDYSKEFEEGFWEPYPRTPVMAKKEAWKEWLKLSPDDQQAAVSAVPRYLAYLKSEPWQKAVHGCRFLSQRRFDGFKADAAKTSQPDWDRWVREYRETNGSRWPWKVAGPEPVMLSCRAPPEILAKHGYGGDNVLPLGERGRSSAADKAVFDL